jgi:ribonuclease R
MCHSGRTADQSRHLHSPSAYSKAKSGQVVVAKLQLIRRSPQPGGRIVDVLGWPDDPEVEVKTILSKYELPHLFSAAAVEQARAVPQAPAAQDMRGRTDLRGNLTVTIDGETARDFDDAVSVRKEEGDLIRLWVSIADVAHYVKEGSFLDLDAYARGTSVYFPTAAFRCFRGAIQWYLLTQSAR